MTTLQAEFEALMPEAVAKVLRWTNGSYHRNYQIDWTGHANEGETLYTADHMRAMFYAATERAAKKVEEVGPKEGSLALVTAGFAAAIRAAGGEG